MSAQTGADGGDRAGFDPGPALAEVETATEHFLASAARLDDDTVRQPSLLPGWSRGHVLAHVARNADGLVNLLTWARTGVESMPYASRATRDDDIESGSGRPLAEHLQDLQDSAARFAAAVAEVPADRWDVPVRWNDTTERPARAVLAARLREVEIHHVDLGLDHTPAHWHEDFSAHVLDGATRVMTAAGDAPAARLHAVDTDRTWELGAPDESSPLVAGPQAALLAWLIGRSSGDGLTVEPDGATLPTPPSWS